MSALPPSNTPARSSLVSWIILLLAASTAFLIFTAAIAVPDSERAKGDAMNYLKIADGFRSAGDAFEFAGARTYGFPLFLYLVRQLTSVRTFPEWLNATSGALFAIHLVSSLCFYGVVLRRTFQRAMLPGWTAAVAGALILTYPGIVTIATTPLTDAFCVDLLMLAAVLLFIGSDTGAGKQTKPEAPNLSAVRLGAQALCGLIVGYAIMVRPSFWPAAIVFFCVALFAAARAKLNRAAGLLGVAVMGLGSMAVIGPALEKGRVQYGSYSLQNPKFVRESTAGSMQSGISAVRVFWSNAATPGDPLPGVKDPLLSRAYSGGSEVKSVSSLFRLLASKPLIVPLFFGKKLIALFDVPHWQPYAVDLTPQWFAPIQRGFEVLAFCGFISLVGLCAGQVFLGHDGIWQSLPWAGFLGGLLFTHSLMHIEGRYGFPAVPFSIMALFLAFSASRTAGPIYFRAWAAVMAISAIVFLWQVLSWDAVPT